MFKRKNKKRMKAEKKHWPEIEVTALEIKKAIHEYYKSLPKGVSLTVLIMEDNKIDMNLLAPFLNGIPKKTFYMSRATYEIFEEPEIPANLDLVQQAVDEYMKEHSDLPIIDGDPNKQVSYSKLSPYLHGKTPNIPIFITDIENMVTHQKPKGGSFDDPS
ncbi:DUF3939 domain-containing protein [Microaerobacter geothermalis]|nr:DUF3939 domain-containing protein [Microaerobacter geothermalis]